MSKKVLRVLSVISLAAAAAVIAPYCIRFWGAPLSLSPEAWGAFGSYVGGTLGPPLAFLGLIGIVWTIREQMNASRVAKEAAERESEYLARKEKKEEWQTIIEHSEKQIESFLNLPIQYKNGVPAGKLVHALFWAAEPQ